MTAHTNSRVLIVEDSPTQARQLAFLLEEAGFQVAVAPDAEQAWERLARERCDIVLTDLLLPGASGFDLCRRIKADPTLNLIPIVAVSSFAMKGDEEKARAAGCDHYVTKPYSPIQLLRVIRGYFGETF